MRNNPAVVTDETAYKTDSIKVTTEMFVGMLLEKTHLEVFELAGKKFHNQLESASKKVSAMANTLDENIFQRFSMRIKDNMETLQKFDAELILLQQGKNGTAIASYTAVLQAELRGLLESITECE